MLRFGLAPLFRAPLVRSCAAAAVRQLPTAAGTSALALARPQLRSMATVKQPLHRRMHIIARRSLIIGGVVVVTGGAAWILYRVSRYMSSLNFYHVSTFGAYVGGIVTSAAIFAGFFIYRRFTAVHPEELFRETFRKVSTNPAILARMGTGKVQPGRFKAFSNTGGIHLDRSSWLPRPRIEPMGLQLIYQLVGKDSATAMVSVSTMRCPGRKYRIKSLVVDFVDGQRMILAGKESDIVYRGIIRLR
eukprot:m.14345 g.14345  ORF g.14345 m.14345 type:complete len:246 (+) comp3362_c0_seq1:1633-2370(+)